MLQTCMTRRYGPLAATDIQGALGVDQAMAPDELLVSCKTL